jgi:hypothetical protein
MIEVILKIVVEIAISISGIGRMLLKGLDIEGTGSAIFSNVR